MNNDQRPRVSLPIEIKIRELDGKFWLALHLARAGYTVTLGDKGVIRRNVQSLDPDIYFGLGPVKRTSRKLLFEHLREAGRSSLVLYTEGGAFRNKTSTFARLHSDEILSLCDGYIAWGQKSADIVSQASSLKRDSIHITGTPEFDLLHEDLREFYKDNSVIGEDLDDFILVNTNFPSVNPFDGDPQGNARIIKDRDKDEFEHSMFTTMLDGIERIAEGVDSPLVIRPHQGEHHDTYREKFKHFSNVRVIHRGSVRHWLYSASVVIHNNCTTGIEGALMQKPVLAYVPEEYPDFEHLSNRVSHKIRTGDELLTAVRECVNGNPEPYLTDEDRTSLLKTHLENLDGKAAQRITEAIDNVVTERSSSEIEPIHTGSLKKLTKKWLRNWFGEAAVKRIQYIRKGNSAVQYFKRSAEVLQLMKKGESPEMKSDQKFPGLDRHELVERLRKIQKITSGFEQIKIDSIDSMPDVFTIYQSSDEACTSGDSF